MCSSDKQNRRGFHLEHWQVVNIGLIVYDMFAVSAAYFLALWLRFDCSFSAIDPEFLKAYYLFAPIYAPVCWLVFRRCRLYQSIWRFASYNELLRTIVATVITGFLHAIGITAIFCRMPITYYIFGIVLQFLAVLGIRFSYRFVLLLRGSREKAAYAHRVMLVGAGAAGQMLLRDIMKACDYQDRVCCIIDDNPNKWNRYIDGVPVVGGREDILTNVEKYHIDKIYLALPSATAEDMSCQFFLKFCRIPLFWHPKNVTVWAGTIRVFFPPSVISINSAVSAVCKLRNFNRRTKINQQVRRPNIWTSFIHGRVHTFIKNFAQFALCHFNFLLGFKGLLP